MKHVIYKVSSTTFASKNVMEWKVQKEYKISTLKLYPGLVNMLYFTLLFIINKSHLSGCAGQNCVSSTLHHRFTRGDAITQSLLQHKIHVFKSE